MAQLHGTAVMGYDPAMVTPGDVVTLQTGTGVTIERAPAKVAKGHGHPKRGGTAGTSTGAGSAAYGPVSAVSQPLAPWDPRACNAAGTGPAR
jgi:hypothetical protein